MPTSALPLPQKLEVLQKLTGSPMVVTMITLLSSAPPVFLRFLSSQAVLPRCLCRFHQKPDHPPLWILGCPLLHSLPGSGVLRQEWRHYVCGSPQHLVRSSRGHRRCAGCRPHLLGPCAAAGRKALFALEASSGGGSDSARLSPLR